MKTKEQRKLLWKNMKIPLFWVVITEHKNCMSVMNWLTGDFDILDK